MASALAVLLLSCGASRAAPLTWGAPAVVDHEPEFAMPYGLSSVSCPSATFCAASGSTGTPSAAQGEVFVSTDPGGGWSSWQSIPVATSHRPRADLMCLLEPSASATSEVRQCGRVDRSSRRVPGAWTVAHIDSVMRSTKLPAQLVEISCPSTSLCVAVDDAGDAVVLDPTRRGRRRMAGHARSDTYQLHGPVVSVDLVLRRDSTRAGNVWATSDPSRRAVGLVALRLSRPGRLHRDLLRVSLPVCRASIAAATCSLRPILATQPDAWIMTPVDTT